MRAAVQALAHFPGEAAVAVLDEGRGEALEDVIWAVGAILRRHSDVREATRAREVLGEVSVDRAHPTAARAALARLRMAQPTP